MKRSSFSFFMLFSLLLSCSVIAMEKEEPPPLISDADITLIETIKPDISKLAQQIEKNIKIVSYLKNNGRKNFLAPKKPLQKKFKQVERDLQDIQPGGFNFIYGPLVKKSALKNPNQYIKNMLSNPHWLQSPKPKCEKCNKTGILFLYANFWGLREEQYKLLKNITENCLKTSKSYKKRHQQLITILETGELGTISDQELLKKLNQFVEDTTPQTKTSKPQSANSNIASTSLSKKTQTKAILLKELKNLAQQLEEIQKQIAQKENGSIAKLETERATKLKKIRELFQKVACPNGFNPEQWINFRVQNKDNGQFFSDLNMAINKALPDQQPPAQKWRYFSSNPGKKPSKEVQAMMKFLTMRDNPDIRFPYETFIPTIAQYIEQLPKTTIKKQSKESSANSNSRPTPLPSPQKEQQEPQIPTEQKTSPKNNGCWYALWKTLKKCCAHQKQD